MTHVNDLAEEHARYWSEERAYDRAGAWIYDDDPGNQDCARCGFDHVGECKS